MSEHSAACTAEMRARGVYAADCEPCEEWMRSLQRMSAAYEGNCAGCGKPLAEANWWERWNTATPTGVRSYCTRECVPAEPATRPDGR